MRLIWKIEPHDVARVKAFFKEYNSEPLVQERQQRNLAEAKPALHKEEVWEVLVGCLLTTQQRSGPGSAVARFVGERPFPLRYEACLAQIDLGQWVQEVLRDFGGIRRHVILAREVSGNLAYLEEGLWRELMMWLDRLRLMQTAALERETAEFVRHHLQGFGPKQSRNFLQWLGLTRYEIPLDSRITKWLNGFGFPLRLSASALADPDYYNFVSDGFQRLCAESDLLPCLLDAAIFTSFDT